jgi:outer membrane receptor protein involved in Fe transport
MKPIFIWLCLLLAGPALYAQNNFSFTVADSATHEPLAGVTVLVENTTNGTVTDLNGAGQLTNLKNGLQTLVFSYVGYNKLTREFSFPLDPGKLPVIINLSSEGTELDEVVISSSRSNSRIEDLAQKVEVLGEEELLEESTIKPGNISSILGDISVIHIQQTSATNGNVAVRMQGLDGKYTQILRDGIPAFDGFSGSFDVMSIPPLDLKQVEIIKGAASTLYGGGAIAGLINLISKTPADSNEYLFTANYSTLREANLNGFFSGKKNRFGFTMFAGTTQQMAVDVNKDGFSDVAKMSSYIGHPRLFIDIAPAVKLNLGYTGTYETRTGGDMQVIKFKADSLHRYIEDNKIQRHTADLQLSAVFKKLHYLNIKGAANIFDRSVNQSGSLFHGRQITTYTEAAYTFKTSRNTLVAGFNYLNDDFSKLVSDSVAFGNYNYSTYGLFAQNNWQVHEKLSIEAGMRADYHSRYKWFFLPRLAFLIKPVNNVSVRLSSGTGYKTPGLFAAKDYSGRFNQLMPVASGTKAEYSVGANTDINYHAVFLNELTFEFNQAFYYTWIKTPLLLQPDALNRYTWVNGNFNIHSWGSDTYIRLGYKHLEIYLGYNHTTSRQIGGGVNTNILFAPNNKMSSTIVYEIENKWRFGIEGSLIATQYIQADKKAKNYYFLAAMIERKIGRHWSLILNGENLLNVRQQNYVQGSTLSPTFASLYAPIDGWVLNLCVRLKL